MNIRDFLVTPILLLIILVAAYMLSTREEDIFSRQIYLPALGLKLISAILLGVIYQFYYGAGDTINYFNQGQIITEALHNNFRAGIHLLLSHGQFDPDTFIYSARLFWYRNPAEMFIVKLSGLLGFILFNNYSSNALIFALISFGGSWRLFKTVIKIYPQAKSITAFSIFFIPSVVFWGSGLMKDSIMLGILGWLFYAFNNLLIDKKKILKSVIIIVLGLYILYTIRIYILLAFIPPALFWIFIENSNRIKNRILRIIARPLFIIFGLMLAYYAAINVTAGSDKYDINNISERTKINAEYLYSISKQQQGSAYFLGKLDGSFESILSLAPKAVFVTFYRPFLWEVRNPLMFLSAIESSSFLLLTIYILFNPGIAKCFKIMIDEPFILFSILFSIGLAIGVGLNSYNFGTLVRYKIPLLPFLTLSILLMLNYKKLKSR